MPGSMGAPGLVTGRAWLLAEELLTQVSFQTLSQAFSGWMTKPARYLMPGSIVHISVNACDRLLLLCDGKPQLRHAPAAKK